MGEYEKVWMGFHPKFYLTYHFFIIKKRKKIKKKIKWICTAWLCTSQNCPYQFIKSYSEDSTLWNDNINREHRAWLYIAQQEASVWAAGEIIINNNKQLSCVRLFVTPWTVSPWNAPGQNTGVGSLSILQGIFPTQGLNPDLLHCRQILYQLSHKGSPGVLEWVAYPFSSRSFRQNWTVVSCMQVDSLPTEL